MIQGHQGVGCGDVCDGGSGGVSGDVDGDDVTVVRCSEGGTVHCDVIGGAVCGVKGHKNVDNDTVGSDVPLTGDGEDRMGTLKLAHPRSSSRCENGLGRIVGTGDKGLQGTGISCPLHHM